MTKRMTVDLDNELFQDLQDEAARSGKSPNDIVITVLWEWLEQQEADELREELAEARAEYERDGGIEATKLFRELRAGWTKKSNTSGRRATST